jgi:hypothetical protein
MVANYSTFQATEGPQYTHRYYLDACGIGEVGILTGDSSLLAFAKTLIVAGLAAQNPAGWNPEDGGYDVSYNGLGLKYALRYRNVVDDGSLGPQIVAMATSSAAWMLTRLQPNNQFNLAGDTRVGGSGNETTRTGATKTMDAGTAYGVFGMLYFVTGQMNYLLYAQNIAIAYGYANNTLQTVVVSNPLADDSEERRQEWVVEWQQRNATQALMLVGLHGDPACLAAVVADWTPIIRKDMLLTDSQEPIDTRERQNNTAPL